MELVWSSDGGVYGHADGPVCQLPQSVVHKEDQEPTNTLYQPQCRFQLCIMANLV